MDLFQRLKGDAEREWSAYVSHEFVGRLGAGSLPEACFRHYLIQDYLFLIQFARAYALGIYKSPTVDDMRASLEGVKAILDVELDLHIEMCAGWGMCRDMIEASEEDRPTMAYTRFVLETGMAGDLLDLQVALAPCIIGYAEIGADLEKRYAGDLADNPYRRWIAEYAGDMYQELAKDFGDWMDRTAEIYLTEARFPRLATIFRKASILEADFWQMGLDAEAARV
ncbi:TenA family protein [uncultured Roseibium sp.]|uniref:TenA family protein n=1 Tax=uncultured Roseibium sp. TaxID=1936171 RepID=UPI00321708AD